MQWSLATHGQEQDSLWKSLELGGLVGFPAGCLHSSDRAFRLFFFNTVQFLNTLDAVKTRKCQGSLAHPQALGSPLNPAHP